MYSLSGPAIRVSSTYKNKKYFSPLSLIWMKIHGSWTSGIKDNDIRVLHNSSYHALGACLRP